LEPRGVRRRDWQCRKCLEGEVFAAIVSIVTIGAALSFGAGSAVAADDVTEDQILRALAPAKKPLTRGLSAGPQADPAATAAEGQVRPEDPRPLHAFAVGQRARGNRRHRQGQAEDRSGNQLRLQLGRYQRQVAASVQALGRALSNADLKGSTFVVAGHTDAAGGEAYNQDLSERRADSIKRYLSTNTASTGTDLVTVGYGKSKLKDPSQPMAEVQPPRAGREHGKQDHRVQVNPSGLP
jgi:outer membrane protein OmpA-like peptidoglycan-associated protein